MINSKNIKEAIRIARHIYDLGFDNDGFEDAEDLKKLCRGLAAEAAEICKLLEQVDLETKEDAE